MLNIDNQNIYFHEFSGKTSNNLYRIEFYNVGNQFTNITYIEIPDCITKNGKLIREFDKITKGLHSNITYELELDLNVLKEYGTDFDEFELLIKNNYEVNIDLNPNINEIYPYFFNRYFTLNGIVCRIFVNGVLFYTGVCEDDFSVSADLLKNTYKLKFSNVLQYVCEKLQFKTSDTDNTEYDYARNLFTIDLWCAVKNQNPTITTIKTAESFLGYDITDNGNIRHLAFKEHKDCTMYFMQLSEMLRILFKPVELLSAYYYRDTNYVPDTQSINYPEYTTNDGYFTNDNTTHLEFSGLYVLWSVFADNSFSAGSISTHTKAGIMLSISEKYDNLWDFIQDYLISEDRKYIIDRSHLKIVKDWQNKATASVANYLSDLDVVMEYKDLVCGDARITEFQGSSEFTAEKEINNKKHTVNSRNKQDFTIPIIFNTGYIDFSADTQFTPSNYSNYRMKIQSNDSYTIDKLFYVGNLYAENDSYIKQVGDNYRNTTNNYDYIKANFNDYALAIDSQGKFCKLATLPKENLKYYSKAWTLSFRMVIPYDLSHNYTEYWLNFDINNINKSNFAISQSQKYEFLKSEIDLDSDTIELTLITSEYEG